MSYHQQLPYPGQAGGYPQQQQGGYYNQQQPQYAQHQGYADPSAYHQQQADPYGQHQQQGMDYGQDPFAGGAGYPPQQQHGYGAEEPPYTPSIGPAPSTYSDPFVGSKEKLPREDGGFTGAGADSPRVRRGSVAAMMAAAGEIPRKEGLRMWRADEHEGEFGRGGRKRACGRCACCTAVVVLLIIIGVVAGFLLWVRPPNVAFNGIEAPNAPLQEFQSQTGGFLINFNLDVGVSNPNFFGAHFEEVTAKAFSPANKSMELGGGTQDNIDISSHSNTTIHFPFTINYTIEADPEFTVLTSLATSCGFIGGVKSPIQIDYSLTVKVKVVAFSISPTFSKSTSLDCPIDKDSLVSMLAASGSSTSALGPLASLLLGSKRSVEEIAPAPAMLRTRRRHGWGWAALQGLY